MPSSFLKLAASQSTILYNNIQNRNEFIIILKKQTLVVNRISNRSKTMLTLSKSSPPKCVSPEVESTSNTPSPTSRTKFKHQKNIFNKRYVNKLNLFDKETLT